MATLKQMCWLPITKIRKAQAIRTYAHTKALYGCETARPDEAALGKYTNRILDVMTYNGGIRSADLVFNIGSRGDDLDPNIEILVRRVAALRRLIAKDTELKSILDDTLSIVTKNHYPGTYHSDCILADLQPTKRGSSVDRGDHLPPNGPITHLLDSLHMCGAVLDTNYNILQANEVPIDILRMPHQHLALILLFP